MARTGGLCCRWASFTNKPDMFVAPLLDQMAIGSTGFDYPCRW